MMGTPLKIEDYPPEDRLIVVAVQSVMNPRDFAHDCHAASLHLVRSGALGEARVARGTTPGVGGQHSWVVLGHDVFDPDAKVVDTTAWSYMDAPEIWVWPNLRDHRPHGLGVIWHYGPPMRGSGDDVDLTDAQMAGLSYAAAEFLRMIGPLDLRGWIDLANGPMQGWPATEILSLMADDPRLAALVPIDRLGMMTDRNPGGLYLKEE